MSGFAKSIGLDAHSRIARSVNILHAAAFPSDGEGTPEHEDAVLKAVAEAAGLSRWPTYTELAGAYQRKLRGMQSEASETVPELWRKANEDLRALIRHLISRDKEIPEEHQQVANDSMFGAVLPGRSSEGTGKCLQGLAAIMAAPHTVCSSVTKDERTECIPSAESPGFVLWLWTITLEAGYRGPYPWSKLVQWWHMEAPVDIDETNDRPDPMLPAPLVMVDKKSRLARLYSSPGRLVLRDDGQAYLPGFAPGEEWGSRLPCLPLALYDLGQHNVERRGRGAPLALRLFVEAVLNVPMYYWSESNGVRLPAKRLRHMLPWLYGDGAKRYRPASHWSRLHAAFRALESDEARIPFEDPKTGYGGALRVVTPVVIPREGRLDDWVRFSVHMPPGSDKGPLIDRDALRLAGLNSAPAYRMALALSFMWHDRGRLRVPIDKRKRQWAQTRQERRYPRVDDEELIWMAYPVGHDVGITAGALRQRLYLARKALRFLETIGFAKTTSGGGIMPGPKWAGWGDREITVPTNRG